MTPFKDIAQHLLSGGTMRYAVFPLQEGKENVFHPQYSNAVFFLHAPIRYCTLNNHKVKFVQLKIQTYRC